MSAMEEEASTGPPDASRPSAKPVGADLDSIDREIAALRKVALHIYLWLFVLTLFRTQSSKCRI